MLYVFVSRHVGFIVDVYVRINVVSMTISLYYSAVYKSPYWLQLKLEVQTCKAWYVVMVKQNKWQCEDCTFQNHNVMQYCEACARIRSDKPTRSYFEWCLPSAVHHDGRSYAWCFVCAPCCPWGWPAMEEVACARPLAIIIGMTSQLVVTLTLIMFDYNSLNMNMYSPGV